MKLRYIPVAAVVAVFASMTAATFAGQSAAPSEQGQTQGGMMHGQSGGMMSMMQMMSQMGQMMEGCNAMMKGMTPAAPPPEQRQDAPKQQR